MTSALTWEKRIAKSSTPHKSKKLLVRCRPAILGRTALSFDQVKVNEQIKALIETEPFQRFFIDINDGRSVEVQHPDKVIVVRFAVTIEDDATLVRIFAY